MTMEYSNNYSDAWQRYKWNKRIPVISIILFLPFLFLFVRPIYMYYQKDWIMYSPLLLLLAIWMVCSWRTTTFLCPRCNKYYYHESIFKDTLFKSFIILISFMLRGRYSNPKDSRDKCINCHLPMWSLDGNAINKNGA